MYQLFLYTSADIIRDLHTRARAHTHRPYGEMSSLRCIGSKHHPNRHKITASEGHYLDILRRTAFSSAESWRVNAYRRPPHRSTLANSHEIALGDPTGSAGAAQGPSQLNTQLDGSGEKIRQNQLCGIVSFSALILWGTAWALCQNCFLLKFFKSLVVSLILTLDLLLSPKSEISALSLKPN